MIGKRKKMLVWPPITSEDCGGWPACYAYMSWFVGHLAEELRLLVVPSVIRDSKMPNYVSAACFHDADRIDVIPVESSAADKALFINAEVVLLRRRDVSKNPPLIPLRRMQGSERVLGIQETKDQDAPCYYFMGDPERDKQDAYYAVCFTYWLQGGEDKVFLNQSRERLLLLKKSAEKASQVSVFGTGPSISESLGRDHSASFNIICNTIVKNRSFLEQLDPAVIVASDAHFHFSFHRYSARFLSDLLYLLEKRDTSFFTFDKFASFAKSRVSELEGRIFGIPAGRNQYGFDLDRDYRVYGGESVLNMFLLPMASFLGNQVSLHGFTGRAPSDSYFWSHSGLHQYPDLMEDVRLAHPAFFANRDYPGFAETIDRQISERVATSASHGKTIRSETTSFYSSFKS